MLILTLMSQKIVYFNGEIPAGAKSALDPIVRSTLGGKGLSLAAMKQINMPVPPFYTICCQTCNLVLQNNNQWPQALVEQNKEAMIKLQEVAGKVFYNDEKLNKFIGSDYKTISAEELRKRASSESVPKPLLVSVRSGAAQSLPGMMDTILNLGLNNYTTELTIAKNPTNEKFVLDCYRRFIMMFSDVVLGVDSKKFEVILSQIKAKYNRVLDCDLQANELREVVAGFLELTNKETGKPFPQDTEEQLTLAINAVFRSWYNPRAYAYRNMNKIPHDLGTAVNICTMVFGNYNNISGSGVGFTRDPKTGERYNYIYGEFLKNAQGEDVVAGVRTPIDIHTMQNDTSDNCVWQRIYKELEDIYKRLEDYYNDLVDLEFTIEDGHLYMLQSRVGKRTAFAMVRIAIDMVKEGRWTKEEALLKIEPNKLNEFLFPRFDQAALKAAKKTAQGLSASPGAAVGQIVFKPERAQQLKAEQKMSVILCREETSPEDIQGMNSSVGVLTSCGGQTSHAAVVARQMGKTCVCGCSEIIIDEEKGTITFPDGSVKHELDWISIDGSTGAVYSEKIALVDAEITPELQQILDWADQTRTLMIRTNADTKKDCQTAIKYGAEGIGLTRSEHQFFEKTKIKAMRKMIVAIDDAHRDAALVELKELQKSDFRDLFETMDGRPVNIRLLDPPLHEFLPPVNSPLVEELSKETGVSVEAINEQIISVKEQNPMIGFRGCRLGVVYPEISRMQISAIFEAAIEVRRKTGKEPKVEIMIPFIISDKELQYFMDMIKEVKAEVEERMGEKINNTAGTMVELPRAAITAEKLAAVCDYFSFGTNDLTQTTLGCSRDDCGRFMPKYLEKQFLKADPFVSIDQDGVGKLIQMAVDKARSVKPHFKVGICGEQTDPVSIEFLQKVGLTYISCSPYRVLIARVAAAIAAIKAGAKKE